MHIGNQIQLLADDYMVEDRWKLTRTTGEVMNSLHNPVLVRDKPIRKPRCISQLAATGFAGNDSLIKSETDGQNPSISAALP